MGNHVNIDFPPQRIVSVVPSQTELLFALGLDEAVVGITRFCVHPEHWFRNKARIGGTKQLHIDKIRSLQPDLVIANKEENEKEQIEILAKEFPVWVSDIKTAEHGLQMIRQIGQLVNKESAAVRLAGEIRNAFDTLPKTSSPQKVAYFIWYKPWMSVGRDTFIHDMLQRTGWENVFADKLRYPEIDPDTLRAADPHLVLLSSEPFPFKEQHVQEIKSILPFATVKLVDGEMFSWYGSRMLYAAEYFHTLLQRE